MFDDLPPFNFPERYDHTRVATELEWLRFFYEESARKDEKYLVEKFEAETGKKVPKPYCNYH